MLFTQTQTQTQTHRHRHTGRHTDTDTGTGTDTDRQTDIHIHTKGECFSIQMTVKYQNWKESFPVAFIYCLLNGMMT